MDPSKQAPSSNSVELHKKLGLLSDELNDRIKSKDPKLWEEFTQSSSAYLKLLNNKDGLQKNEEYYATTRIQQGIHQKMFEAFPDLLEERDRLITAIATNKEAETTGTS